jgi:hypothetical protein
VNVISASVWISVPVLRARAGTAGKLGDEVLEATLDAAPRVGTTELVRDFDLERVGHPYRVAPSENPCAR